MNTLNIPHLVPESAVTSRLRQVRVIWLLIGVLATLFVGVVSLWFATTLSQQHGLTTNLGRLALVVSVILAISVLVTLVGVVLYRAIRRHPLLAVLVWFFLVALRYAPAWYGFLSSWHGHLAAGLESTLTAAVFRALSSEIAVLVMVLIGYFVLGFLRMIVDEVLTVLRSSFSNDHGGVH